ncbi:insulinase family protein [Pontibacillus sp. ALD_SL1]|uniref:EF-P 5-aminopentanol modification-associated protein YfmH n=1 Tax=Pontibacillus sp. ALD_SL1 TaxID=2777185 RepID=UPI001A965A64|nr:pitrilysin family protein [Pontibacillus sp. ALD_SL1]QST01647.1 insulinase family protein [Pontibacillus sp. ALD_SL1]
MKTTNYDQIQETLYSKKLENGLEVYLLPKREMAKTFAVFTTEYGSIDQTFTPLGKDEQVTVPEGIAHFLEHKLFEKEDRDVFQDFSKQGASPNAFTSFTSTAYLFSATSQISENVQTLLDFVQNPYFSDESVEKEKGIIAQEIRMYDDQPDWRSFFGTIQSLFEEHPVKIDIAGTVDSIQNITKEDLYTCYETFYHPSNMTFFLAGNFDPETMMKQIEDNQSSKSFAPPEDIKRSYPSEPKEVANKHKVIEMPVSVSKCLVGVKEDTSSLTKDTFLQTDMIKSMVLDHFFSKSGEYFEKLYKEDLVDDSFSFETHLHKTFGFTILGGNTREPEKFQKRVKEMLHELKERELTDEEFERMKKKRIGQFLRSMNSLEFIATTFVQYRHLGIDLFQVLPEIEKLTKKDVMNHIQNWISENRIAVCEVRPSEA